jgi:hypothetical protein
MSYVSTDDDPADKGSTEDHRLLFKDVIAELGADLIGAELWQRYRTWPMYSKFFDYRLPLFHHLHPDDTAARRVGRLGKPEAYYFPIQLNNYPGEFPLTYFGFNIGLTKEMVKQRLADYEARDTRLMELSRAYRLTLGTGWYIPAGFVLSRRRKLYCRMGHRLEIGEIYDTLRCWTLHRDQPAPAGR